MAHALAYALADTYADAYESVMRMISHHHKMVNQMSINELRLTKTQV